MQTLRFLIWASVLCAGQSFAGGIYWTNRGQSRVERAGFDGSGRSSVLLNAGTNLRGIALDPEAGTLYYADNGSDVIYRMGLDGSDRVPILQVGPSAFPADIRLDLTSGRLYYCDRDKDHIRRSGLDGMNPEVVIGPGTQPYYLDIDFEAGHVYWGDFDGATANTGNVFRANLDGSNRETVVTGTLETRAVCLDTEGRMLYWVNRNAGAIQRAALDSLPVNAASSGAVETVYSGLDTPHGMALDVTAGMLYWVDTGTNETGGLGAQGVSRGRMDGSIPQEVLVSLGSEPWDIDLDMRCADYGEWVARFFPRNPGATSDPEADPDGDTATNLLECGLGTHPLRRDAPLPAGEAFFWEDEGSGLVYPAFRYVRRAGMEDVWVIPQHASGLSNWWDETLPLDGLPHLVELGVEGLGEGLERVEVRSIFSVDAIPGQEFRLRVRIVR